MEPEPRAGSATPPGRASRAALVAAFLLPAALVGIPCIARLLSRESTPPSVALNLFLARCWAGSLLRRGWRGTLVEIGALLLSRIGLPALVWLAFLAAVVAASDQGGTLQTGLAAWLAGLCLASAARLLESDRPRLKRGLLILAFQLALLAGADLFARVVVLPGKSHNNIFIVHDPDLGWRLRPGLSVLHRAKAYTSRETINSHGFRTREAPFEKPPGTLRVVVLGDSHTEAYVVNDGETWTAELERRLAERTSSPVEVLALGAGGWSTDQELLAYTHVGRRFDPDLVILQFCGNDVPFNVLDHYWRGRKPRFERIGDQLFLTGVPVPNARNTGLLTSDLVKRSALAVLLESMLRQVAIDREVDGEGDLEEGWRVTGLLVRDLQRLALADGARFAILNANAYAPEVDSRVRAIASEHGVAYLETVAAYAGEFASYWTEGHWSRKGQAAIAEVLAPQVAGMLPPPDASR